MSEFDNREKAFEKKFEVEGEFRFKVASRAAKTLAHWAAQKLGLTGPEEEAYVRLVLQADLSSPRHNALVGKIEKDFQDKGVAVNRQVIALEFEKIFEQVKEQMLHD